MKQKLSPQKYISATKYLKWNLSLLKLTRMRHVTTSNKSWSDYIKKLLTALLFVNAIIIMTSEVINLAIVTNNLEQVTAAIAVLSLHVQGLSKWLNMVINRQQLSEIIRLFDECFQVGTGCEKLNETRAKERLIEPYEDKTSESSRSSAMFSGCHLRSKILTLLWVLLCIQGELNWILIPIFNCLTRVNEGVTDVSPESCRVLPLPGWHPVDTSSSPCYEILYLMQVLCNTTTVLAMVVFDVFALSLMMFTCGHFRCLKMYLKHIVVDERDMLENGNSDVGFTYGNGQYLDSLDELVPQNHAHDESGESFKNVNLSIESNHITIITSTVLSKNCLKNARNYHTKSKATEADTFFQTSNSNKSFNNTLVIGNTNGVENQSQYFDCDSHTPRENIKYQSQLVHCIRYHQLIIRFINEMNRLFSPVMFVQCLLNLMIVCLSAFEATTIQFIIGKQRTFLGMSRVNVVQDEITEYGIKLLMRFQFLAAAFVQVFLFCWYANEITVLGESVQDAAAKCDWVNADQSFKKSLRLLINRTQVPIRMTGGKFYILSVETFTELMRLAFSYFTVLRQVNEKQNTPDQASA